MQMLSSGEIERLSPAERMELIGQLWDSLQHVNVPLPLEQAAELKKRLKTLDHDRAHAVTWEQLQAELARRCPE